MFNLAMGYQSPLRDDNAPQDSYEVCCARPDRLGWDEIPQFRTVFRDPRLLVHCIDRSNAQTLEGLRITQQVLQHMHRTLKAHHNSRLAIVLIPSKFNSYEELINRSPGNLSQVCQEYFTAERDITQELESRLSASGILVVNTGPALRRALMEGAAVYPMSDDGHPNAHGYRVIAQEVQRAVFGTAPSPN
jgi:lysophospholipase L1-like esterase